jgi:hypothetical protein
MKSLVTKKLLPFAILGGVFGLYSQISQAAGNSSTSFQDALFKNANTHGELKYRYEGVEEDNALQDAEASTGRIRLGYKSGTFYDFFVMAEYEFVHSIGSAHFNSGENGNNQYSAVIDPDNSKFNQLFVSYTGIQDTSLIIGRRNSVLNNGRLVNNFAWRQHDFTYDSAILINNSIEDLRVVLVFIDYAETPGLFAIQDNTKNINLVYSGFEDFELTAYYTRFDISNAPVVSSQNLGFRIEGSYPLNDDMSLTYDAEFIDQKEYAGNPMKYSANYLALEAGLEWDNASVSVGSASLGGQTGNFLGSFRTPAGGGHSYHGWADQFQNIGGIAPEGGLDDRYVMLSANLPFGLSLVTAYHDFSAEDDGRDWGTEFDISLSKTFMGKVQVMLKYADYNADQFSVDTQKAFFEVSYSF